MSETITPLSAKLALLDFIEQTYQFAQGIDMLGDYHGPRFAKRSGCQSLFNDSQVAINDALHRVGGLDATIDAFDDHPEFQVTLTRWHGRDPDNSERYLWIAQRSAQFVLQPRHLWAGAYIQPPTLGLSLDASAIPEMRQKLITELLPASVSLDAAPAAMFEP